jgi:hypothetical protein
MVLMVNASGIYSDSTAWTTALRLEGRSPESMASTEKVSKPDKEGVQDYDSRARI